MSFFSELVSKGIPFVTWEKNIDSKTINAIDEKKFNVNFEFNNKEYCIFENKKSFTFDPENPDEERHDFTLRHIYIWNKSSKRKTCGLAWTGDKEMSTARVCACDIEPLGRFRKYVQTYTRATSTPLSSRF
ncbi:MAG: hypothetical protein JRE47_08960 [Deltaproteobacteria bacterium]|nr:hypothetical protein [Deltaproteobacteria bacterium]